jgi:signal transduction histidine kinase
MARMVIVKHGGELTFESEVDRGTTFYIRMPVTGAGQVSATA